MEDFSKKIKEEISQICDVFEVAKKELSDDLAEAVEKSISRIKEGGRIFFIGNGGSAADAQHLACELIVRYQKERRPIPAYALTVNTSILTAAGNDYGFDKIFIRQVQADCHSNDVLVAISTSGASENILLAVEAAKEKGVLVIAFTGKKGEKLAERADINIKVPHDYTPRIQEVHIALGHIYCGLLEDRLYQEEGEC